jgi:hypothetical protein
MRNISPEEITSGIFIITVIAAPLGVWVAGVRMRRTIKRVLRRKATGQDLASINTWMRVDEQAERQGERRLHIASLRKESAPAGLPDSWRPAKILAAVGLVALTFYLEHRIPDGSLWNSYPGRRLVEAPLGLALLLIYWEWKTRRKD